MVAGTIVFLAVRKVLRLLGLGPAPSADDVELAVLRHQLAILRRQVARPRYRQGFNFQDPAVTRQDARDTIPPWLPTRSCSWRSGGC